MGRFALPSLSRRRIRTWRSLAAALFAVMLIFLLLLSGLNRSLLAHSAYDSYTLQAMMWRQGRIALDQDYPWLELAVYKGQYWVSFPPFPTAIMYLLTFPFGSQTPDLAIQLAFLLGSTALCFNLARRLGLRPERAAGAAVFCVCGCNLLEVSLSGGVWNLAQNIAFFFTMASMTALHPPRETRSCLSRFFGPLWIAFAVGCRPFQAIYVPYVLYRLFMLCRKENEKPLRTILAMVPWVIAPGLIAIAYGYYNFVRFDNPLEFGHNYLPEFSTQGGLQFSLTHWSKNVFNIFRLPYFEENRLNFPHFFGFAFYLCNPIFLLAAVEVIRRLVRKTFCLPDAILLLSAALHFNALLLHRTFGGFQFGTRYLIDLIPALMVFVLLKKKRFRLIDLLLMIWAVAFNIYGTVIFSCT